MNTAAVIKSFCSQLDDDDEEEEAVASGRKVNGNMEILGSWYRFVTKVSHTYLT